MAKKVLPKKASLEKQIENEPIEIKDDVSNYVTRLEEEREIVGFSMKINPQTEKITLVYSDTKDKEEFYNFWMYLYSLSVYYRNRLEEVEETEVKIRLCDQFINTLAMYSTDMRLYVKDKQKMATETDLYIKQFQIFKQQYLSLSSVGTSMRSTNDVLSTNEKIIILEYMGLIENMKKEAKLTKNAEVLLSILIDRSSENISKALANLRLVQKAGGVKNQKTLTTVKKVFDGLNLLELSKKAEFDLNKIK